MGLKSGRKISALALSIALVGTMGFTASSASAEDLTVDPDIKTCLNGRQPFRDVNNRTPHAKDTKWMYCADISTGFREGYTDTYTYRGMNNVIRQDMAAFLRRVAVRQGISDAAGWSPSIADWDMFRDVSRDTPHAEDILWLAHSGISTGWNESDGTSTFRPTEAVKRQDMAAFLYRLAKLGGVKVDKGRPMGFSDVSNSTPHAKEIRWLGGAGISTGWKNPNGTARYQGMSNTVRQDMSAFLHRTAGTVERHGYPTVLPTSYNGPKIDMTVYEDYDDNQFHYVLENTWVNYKDSYGDTEKPQLHLVFKITNKSGRTMEPYTINLSAFQHSIETGSSTISLSERMLPNGVTTYEQVVDLDNINEPVHVFAEAPSYTEMGGSVGAQLDTQNLMRNSKVIKQNN